MSRRVDRVAPTLAEFAALEARVEGLETLLAELGKDLPLKATAAAIEEERHRGTELDKPNSNERTCR